MLKISIPEAMDAIHGKLVKGSFTRSGLDQFPSVSIDSRTIERGQAFFAIGGERHDGHEYIEAAIRRGASLVVCSKVPATLPDDSPPVVRVDSTLIALQRMATRVREIWGKPVVAITGSMGKTTTRHFIASFLRAKYRVLETPGNFNNHIGVPLSLLRLEDSDEIAVLELGMNHRGEIAGLSEICRPDAGVITNVAPVHTEFFDSLDEVAAAKGELLQSLSKEGVFFYNADDSRVSTLRETFPGKKLAFGFKKGADYRARELKVRSIHSMQVGIETPEWCATVEVPFAGVHFAYNLICAISVASEQGLSREQILENASSLGSLPMRGRVFEAEGVTIWDDTYNSNPESVKRLLETVAALKEYRRRFVVLGDMLELGSKSAELHGELGESIRTTNTDFLLTVGNHAELIGEKAIQSGFPEKSVHHFEEPSGAARFLQSHLEPGDFVLIKGSRGIHLEKIVATLEGVRQ